MTVYGWKDYFETRGKPWDEWFSAEAYRNRFQLEGLTTIAAVLAKSR